MLDTKLNKMQHSQGELKRLIEAFHFWGPNSKHDFWSEKKPPKKLLNCRCVGWVGPNVGAGGALARGAPCVAQHGVLRRGGRRVPVL